MNNILTIKQLLIGTLLVSYSALSGADTLTRQLDTSPAEHPYTQLCKAALNSEAAFIAKARELKVGKSERNRLVCNEMPVQDFAQAYEMTEQNTIATVQ